MVKSFEDRGGEKAQKMGINGMLLIESAQKCSAADAEMIMMDQAHFVLTGKSTVNLNTSVLI